MTFHGIRCGSPRTAGTLLYLALCLLVVLPAAAQRPPQVSFHGTSVVKKTPSGDRQLVVAQITAEDTLRGVSAEIALPSHADLIPASVGIVPKGTSRHFFEIPVVKGSDSVTFHLLVKNARVLSAKGPISPPRAWKIYDVQVSHHDLGYADYYHFMRRDVREMGLESPSESAAIIREDRDAGHRR